MSLIFQGLSAGTLCHWGSPSQFSVVCKLSSCFLKSCIQVMSQYSSALHLMTTSCFRTDPNLVNTCTSPVHLIGSKALQAMWGPGFTFPSLLPCVLYIITEYEGLLWFHLFWPHFWDKVVLTSTPPSKGQSDHLEKQRDGTKGSCIPSE